MRKFILFPVVLLVFCTGCWSSKHLVSGTVTGLSGTLVLQNNGGEDQTLTSDGSFTFPSLVLEGTRYEVTVLTKPIDQVCAVTNGSGKVRDTDVEVSVTCTAALGETTLIEADPAIGSGIVSTYNNTEDQFLLTWWDTEEDSIHVLIYNADGSIAAPDTTLFDATMTPVSDIAGCYNSATDQYFLAWNEFTTNSGAFAVLDAEGGVVQGVTALSGSHTPVGNVGCSFNSTTSQYFLTWTDVANDNYFAIVDEDGTESHAETLIPNVGGVHSGSTEVLSTYNSAANQYFLTWGGSDFSVYFAIYDADGNAVKTATAIADAGGYSDTHSCYNNADNQYFIPWRDGGGVTYFAIYDDAGDVVSSPEVIDGMTSDIIYGPVYCAYDSLDHFYFVTGIDAISMDVVYAILSNQGDVLVAPTAIDTPDGLIPHKTIYTSFGSDEVMITWLADDTVTYKGYSAFYRFAPP